MKTERVVRMNRKNLLGKMVATMAVAGMMVTSIPVSAAELPDLGTELPQSITMDGKVFIMDESAGGGSGTATADNDVRMLRANSVLSSAYSVLGSDVRLYVDYSHGHGGDHFAAGWVQANAPRFTARAEVWAGGRTIKAGSNNLNQGDIANASSGLAVGLVPSASPRIFYAW